jgi:DNA-binding NarL/FixJ family response regulator
MKALIVEDDPFKLVQIQASVSAKYPQWSTESAISAHSAKQNLRSNAIDIVILDMSLPSFDIDESEAGGRPLNFGGVDVIRFIRRKKLKAKAVVLTQFEEFVEGNDVHNLTSLRAYLAKDFSDIFIGIVYFDTGGQWSKKLFDMLASQV